MTVNTKSTNFSKITLGLKCYRYSFKKIKCIIGDIYFDIRNQKMGWSSGEGLGAEGNQGILVPIDKYYNVLAIINLLSFFSWICFYITEEMLRPINKVLV